MGKLPFNANNLNAHDKAIYEIIDSLKTHGVSTHSFPDPYYLAAEILSATFAWKSIAEKIQVDAIKEYGIYGLIEVMVLSGFYQMFSAINQGFDISQSSVGS